MANNNESKGSIMRNPAIELYRCVLMFGICVVE